jgi:hypothetical protein
MTYLGSGLKESDTSEEGASRQQKELGKWVSDSPPRRQDRTDQNKET